MSFKNIGAEEFASLKENDNHIVLDVRSPEELAEGQVPGHKMINFFNADFRDEVDKLDREKTYLIYCRSGNRSSQACVIMEDMGFKNLYNLHGGIGAWNKMSAVS